MEELLEIYEISVVFHNLWFYLVNKSDGNISNSLSATLE